jgi:hypothetical protein
LIERTKPGSRRFHRRRWACRLSHPHTWTTLYFTLW